MDFITEKETEEWLEQETRSILMPDGSRRPVTDFKVTWTAQDFLNDCTDITEEELCQLATTHAGESGKSYEEAYLDLMAYLQREIRKRYGID